MISIQKIALQELEDFTSSTIFIDLKNKPISKARVKSYLNNPRANKKDIVLYMAFLNKELVGYRTIWTDFFYIENKKESFGWLSGSWVHLRQRRKGISTLLFNEILKDWGSKLMYTNYAEASKSLYDKTQNFCLLHRLEGTKYYVRFSFADILPKKKKLFNNIKVLWIIIDWFLNLFLDLLNVFKYSLKEYNFYVKINEPWNDSIIEFTDNFVGINLFQRGIKEFNWIQKYPWVLSEKIYEEDSKLYYFSSFAKEFNSKICTIYNNNNTLIGYLLLTIRDGHVKIPYAFFYKENTKEIVRFIINQCSEMHVKTIVIYNKVLENEVENQLFFITKKRFTQKYFITKELKKCFIKEQEIEVQPGDGDVVFT